MTARAHRDGQDVTRVETTAKPIEVRLNRPQLEVTCRIVFPDGTAIAVGVDALSLRGAQRELTAWLTERGYEPAGGWSTRDENDRGATCTFRRQGPGDGLPGPRPGAVARSWPSGAEPDLDPAPGRRPRLQAGHTWRRVPEGRAVRKRANAPQAGEDELRTWALAHARRDEVIRAAAAAGVSLQRIQEVTGIARTTIMRILGSAPRPAPRRPQ
jgi:hypothetical protein